MQTRVGQWPHQLPQAACSWRRGKPRCCRCRMVSTQQAEQAVAASDADKPAVGEAPAAASSPWSTTPPQQPDAGVAVATEIFGTQPSLSRFGSSRLRRLTTAGSSSPMAIPGAGPGSPAATAAGLIPFGSLPKLGAARPPSRAPSRGALMQLGASPSVSRGGASPATSLGTVSSMDSTAAAEVSRAGEQAAGASSQGPAGDSGVVPAAADVTQPPSPAQKLQSGGPLPPILPSPFAALTGLGFPPLGSQEVDSSASTSGNSTGGASGGGASTGGRQMLQGRAMSNPVLVSLAGRVGPPALRLSQVCFRCRV